MSRNVVIVGANRGIGLELVKTYLENGDSVFAACRKPSQDLSSTGAEIVDGVDVVDPNSVASLPSRLNLETIDIFIHNAGILKSDHFPEIDIKKMKESFEVNSLGPLRTVLALRDKFNKGTKVGLVSSRVGSIEDNSSSRNYAYRTSKTALNMIGKCLSLDLKDSGIAVALLHPGYVRTDMTGHNGHLDPDESAKGLFKRMEELTLSDTGCFIHSSGERLPW